jgi:hypothetical protein
MIADIFKSKIIISHFQIPSAKIFEFQNPIRFHHIRAEKSKNLELLNVGW